MIFWKCNACNFIWISHSIYDDLCPNCESLSICYIDTASISKIESFKNHFSFLSNFYYAPFKVNGITYKTVEHWFQCHKTHNQEERIAIINCKTPVQAKKIGRRVTLIQNWHSIRDEIMLIGVHNKFSQNSRLRQLLLCTQNIPLIEGNTWHDNYWGCCTCSKCSKVDKFNKLGIILQKVRVILR